MEPHEQQVQALMAEAARQRGALVGYELLEEAVRVADAHRDVRLGFAARLELIRVGACLARGDAITVAFTWCLHQADTRPDLFAGWDLLHEYGLVINGVANYDTVSRDQLEGMIADYGARRVRAGHSPGHQWAATVLAAADLGDREFAARAAGELRRLRQESLLRPGQWFRHAVFLGDADQAMRLAEAEVLAPGRAARFDYEWYELPLLLLAQGRADEARRWQRRAVAQLTRARAFDDYHWGYGAVVAALALTGQMADAVRQGGECQRMIRAHVDPLTRLHFHLDMSVLLDRLHALGAETVMVRFNEFAPGRRPNGRYVVAEVRDWVAREAADLAGRFDRRNGNGHFGDRIRERAELQRLALPEESLDPKFLR